MTLTTSEIEQFLQVCERATPGPWKYVGEGLGVGGFKIVDYTGKNVMLISSTKMEIYWSPSLWTYVATSRTIAPELAREVLSLREKLKIAIDLFEDIIDPAMKGFEIQLSKEALEKIK